MTFLGDEGRDAIVIKGILVDHHIPLLGPVTSIGNIYDGPLYYYMMAISMAIGWLNPLSAAVMVAIIGIVTVGLVYYLARVWFGKVPALIASFLYAISPITIIYSRSSWNPNPAPFFALLSIISLYKLRLTKNSYWLILTGISLAFAVQMHFLSLILIPILGILWLLEFWPLIKAKKNLSKFLINSLLAVIAFLILMSPIALFDIRHDYMDLHAFIKYFTDRQTTVNLNVFNAFSRVPPIYTQNLIGRYLSVFDNFALLIVFSVIVLIPIIWMIYEFIKHRKLNYPIFVLSIWMLIGIVGLALNKSNVFDHYTNFINPSLFLLIGSLYFLISKIKDYKLKIIGNVLYGIFIITIIILSFQKNPFFTPPNNQLQRTQDVSKYLITLSDNKPFNFALLSEHNYDAAYQYYLDLYNHKPQMLPQVKTDQLLVVCEDPVCKPVGNPKYEIAAFGWTKIESQVEYEGVQIFKLVHNELEPKVELK